MADASKQLREVIRVIINQRSPVTGRRLHNLVYRAELVSLEQRGERLTDAEFNRSASIGPYSRDIEAAVEAINPRTQMVPRKNNNYDCKYFDDKLPSRTTLSRDERGAILTALNETDKFSEYELVDEHKDSSFFRQQPTPGPIDFSDYL